MEISRNLDLYYLLVGTIGMVMLAMGVVRYVTPVKTLDKKVAPLYFVFGFVLIVLWMISPNYENTYIKISEETQIALCK